eukprot:XP_001700173.1 predicted protein [Chlamydomonas reinhardtii]
MTHPYKAHSLRDEGSDQVAKASAAAKAQEHILYGARKQRKETDDQLQATRDQEIAATAKDVLAVMPTAPAPKLRPHTGRSALLASLSEGSGGAAAAAATSLRSSVVAQSSSKSLGDGAAGAHGTAGAGTTERRGSGAAAGTSGRASLEGPGAGAAGAGAHGMPPRAPSASRGRPPVPVGRAADKLNKLPPGPRGAATAASASVAGAGAGGPVVSAAPARGSSAEADPDLVLGAGAGGGSRASGLQHLPGTSGHGQGHGQEWEGGDLGAGGAWAAGNGGGRNAMAVIHGGAGGEGAHGAELDAEVIEELAHGHGHGSAAGGAGAGGAGPSGLQEFATESGRRVVQVKGSSRKGDALSLHDYTSHRRGCRVDRLHRLHPPHGAGMDRFLPISPRPRRTC